MKEEFIKGTCCIKLDIENIIELNKFQNMFFEYFNESFNNIFTKIKDKDLNTLEHYKNYPYLCYEDNRIVFSLESFDLKEYIFKDEINSISLNMIVKQILYDTK